MTAVYLTNDWRRSSPGKRARSRRLLGRGNHVRIRKGPYGWIDGATASVSTVFIDGRPVAYHLYPYDDSWSTVTEDRGDGYSGTGIDLVPEG